jgi:hypothetical protein
MFEASVDGQPYDMERWGQYFKPAGMAMTKGDSSSHAPAPAAKPAPVAVAEPVEVDAEDDVPVAQAPVVTPSAAKPAGQRAEDILAMIRNRQK